MAEQPVILIANDDGVTAPGLKALVEAVRSLGKVVVVAPDKPQSGMGHAITIEHPIRLQQVDVFEGIDAYACSGTPVDCVKLAVDKILHRKPDLCLSGINHGSNASINVIYSGTMSAAMEAGIEGIPAAGFSLLDHDYNADFSACAPYIVNVAHNILKHGLPAHTVLNVNFPKLPAKEIKGIKVCRQATAKWVEEFDEREDPSGKTYYWLTGKFMNLDKGDDTDQWALSNGYVSVVPVHPDLTAHHAMSYLNGEWTL